ncbi:MAG: hypothetical protein JWO82_77, partial [Akkermansiaceae bacterium]|nr:hypothetical protein [Akkermansiaceae bacterium]
MPLPYRLAENPARVFRKAGGSYSF